MYTDWTRDLKQNTAVMQDTFNRFNLQVIQFTYQVIEEDQGCDVIIEVSSSNGTAMPENAYIKINMYDGEGNIILTEEELIWANKFTGYNTYKLWIDANDLPVFDARSARIYLAP